MDIYRSYDSLKRLTVGQCGQNLLKRKNLEFWGTLVSVRVSLRPLPALSFLDRQGTCSKTTPDHIACVGCICGIS